MKTEKKQIFKNSLNSIGYYTKSIVLDVAKVTNIPQHRERLFILCFLTKEDFEKFDFNFPQKENETLTNFLCPKIEDRYYIKKAQNFMRSLTKILFII